MSYHIFDVGKGRVPAARHINPDGSLGGWVAASAHVAPTAHIGVHARVWGSARIEGLGALDGEACAYEGAIISDRAFVSEFARVYGCARVGGMAFVYGHAHVTGNAIVTGNAKIHGVAFIGTGLFHLSQDIARPPTQHVPTRTYLTGAAIHTYHGQRIGLLEAFGCDSPLSAEAKGFFWTMRKKDGTIHY